MKYFFLAVLVGSCTFGKAQSNANDIFAAGVADAERFSNDYFGPLSEGALYSISNGWYNSGKAKPLLGFEISLVGNMASFKNKNNKKSFVLNTADYENLQFEDGSVTQQVSTALGDIEGITVFVEGEIAPGITQRQQFELPSGLSGEGINFVPSAFIQASVGVFKGTELKARFLPNIDTDEVSVGFYGVGIQHEFTSLLPVDKIWPVAISGVIGYTHLDASYDFTDTGIIAGSDQRIETDMNSWVFQAVVSTKLPIINFYGGIGYLKGKSTIDFLGTYESGFITSPSVEDPFSLNREVSGVTANVGTKLKLGFFRLNADYTIAEFNSLSVGINFGFR